MMKFNDYYWHDAVIKDIKVDRNNPGINDVIFIDIEWGEKREKATLIFEEVYWLNMNLNFGIIADETILQAKLLDHDNKDLSNFYSQWNGILNDVKLNTFQIDLNSTGGQIKIIAKGFSFL